MENKIWPEADGRKWSRSAHTDGPQGWQQWGIKWATQLPTIHDEGEPSGAALWDRKETHLRRSCCLSLSLLSWLETGYNFICRYVSRYLPKVGIFSIPDNYYVLLNAHAGASQSAHRPELIQGGRAACQSWIWARFQGSTRVFQILGHLHEHELTVVPLLSKIWSMFTFLGLS